MAHDWHKRDNESAVQFKAFEWYRTMGPERTIKGAAKLMGLGYDTCRKYSAAHDWQARAGAWDAHVSEHKDEAVLTTAAELATQHMRDLATERKLAMRVLERSLAASEGDDDALPSVQVAAGLLRDAVANERLVIGEATGRTDERKSIDVSKLSKAGRAALRLVMEEVGEE